MADVLPALSAPSSTPSDRERLSRLVLLKELGWAAGAALVVAASAVAAILLTRAGSSIAILWFANALALVAWLWSRRSRRADLLNLGATTLAFGSANLIVGNPPLHAAVFTTANVLEVALAVWLARRALADGVRLETLSGLTRFIVIVSLAAPLLSASVVGGYVGLQAGRDGVDAALTWYFGHAIGFAVFGVFLLQLRSPATRALFSQTRAAETLSVLGLMLVVCLFAFSDRDQPMGFLVYPALMLAAVRLRLFGAAAATALVATVSSVFLLRDIQAGTLAGEAMIDAVRRGQLYLGFACLPTMAAAVILDERDRYATTAAAGQARAEAASQGKSKLLANVSHEVRTPLNAIIGFGDILLTRRLGDLNEAQEDLLKTMVRSADQLNALAQDLTDVAKAEAGKLSVSLQNLDLRNCAAEVVERLKVKADEFGATIVLEGEGSLPAVADPMRVVQILTNLGTNAIKYAGHAGPIAVRLYRSGPDRVRVEVEDHGPGIPLDRRDELFEPFNRLGKETGQIDGTGIGLAIARRLAELQDGQLDYESVPGEGARFWLELPAASDDATPA